MTVTLTLTWTNEQGGVDGTGQNFGPTVITIQKLNQISAKVRKFLFVLKFYGPVNPMGSCRARSVYLTTRLLGRLTSIVHILSPETDNCPSWISRREKMTIENISWSISTKECCRPQRGLNPQPPGLQSDGASNWVTEAGPKVRK